MKDNNAFLVTHFEFLILNILHFIILYTVAYTEQKMSTDKSIDFSLLKDNLICGLSDQEIDHIAAFQEFQMMDQDLDAMLNDCCSSISKSANESIDTDFPSIRELADRNELQP